MVGFGSEVSVCCVGVGVMFSLSADWAKSATLWLELSTDEDGGVFCEGIVVGEAVMLDGDLGTDGTGNSCGMTCTRTPSANETPSTPRRHVS